jgi:hypothetical protein
VRIATVWIVLFLLGASSFLAQSQSMSARQTNPDRLGMSCAQILQMTSSEWIAKVTSVGDSPTDGQLRGIQGYGKCYEERTDRLAASLAKSGKGPLMGARGNFRDLEAALDDFTSKVLADTEPTRDPVKAAYAALYEKQFRYQFYEGYELKASASKRANAPVPPQATKSTPEPTATPAGAAAPAPTPGVSEMTRAKNRFGELLDALPPDKLHELHAAFGKVIALQTLATAQELALYRYAIFVLEPSTPRAGVAGHAPGAEPFAPPPF